MIRFYLAKFLSAQREHTSRRGDLDDAPGWSPLEKAWAFMLAGLGFALVGVGRYCGWWL